MVGGATVRGTQQQDPGSCCSISLGETLSIVEEDLEEEEEQERQMREEEEERQLEEEDDEEMDDDDDTESPEKDPTAVKVVEESTYL